MNRVQISARIIRWPPECACCCRPSDTEVTVSSTRVTGKRVIHEQTKAWQIPYCRRCLEHIEVSKRLRSFSTFVVHLSVALGLVGAAFAVVGFVAVKDRSFPAAVVLALGELLFFAVVIVLSFAACHAKYQAGLAAKQAELKNLRSQLNSLMCRGCSEQDGIAASYEGWQGTVHIFCFSSQEFVKAFKQANAGKCL